MRKLKNLLTPDAQAIALGLAVTIADVILCVIRGDLVGIAKALALWR